MIAQSGAPEWLVIGVLALVGLAALIFIVRR